MTPYPAALAAVFLLLATHAQADVLLSGPMPALTVIKAKPAANPSGFVPAPRADLDVSAPMAPRSNEAVISPALINRTANRATLGNGYVAGADYSDQMARRGRQATTIGSTLAPAITIRQPLQ